jgi:hypothetical protein
VADVIVRPADIRACGHCMTGARAWFTRHGLDWAAFVRDGLPASTLEATGDGFALRVVERARNGAAQ